MCRCVLVATNAPVGSYFPKRAVDHTCALNKSLHAVSLVRKAEEVWMPRDEGERVIEQLRIYGDERRRCKSPSRLKRAEPTNAGGRVECVRR